MNAKILCMNICRLIKRRNIWFHPNRIGIYPNQKMIHCRIPGYAHPVNMARLDLRCRTHLSNQWIQSLFYNCILQLFPATRLYCLDNTVNYICSVSNLPVSGGCLCQDSSGLHINNQRRHRGRSNVHCKATYPDVLTQSEDIKHFDLIFASSNDTLHIKFIFSQRFRHIFHNCKRNLYTLRAADLLHCPGQALQIRHGIVQCRLVHGHADDIHIVFKHDTGLFHIRFCPLKNLNLLCRIQVRYLHSALICRRDIRYFYFHICDYLTDTGQPPALCVLFIGNMKGLLGIQLSL